MLTDKFKSVAAPAKAAIYKSDTMTLNKHYDGDVGTNFAKAVVDSLKGGKSTPYKDYGALIEKARRPRVLILR